MAQDIQGGVSAQAQKFLGDVNYPAKKQDIIDMAKKKGADQKVLDALNKIPDQVYNKNSDVSTAMGNLM